EGAQSLEDARPVFLADLSRRRIEVLVDDPVLVPVEHMQQGEPLARLLGEKQRVLEGFQGRGREVDGAENRLERSGCRRRVRRRGRGRLYRAGDRAEDRLGERSQREALDSPLSVWSHRVEGRRALPRRLADGANDGTMA